MTGLGKAFLDIIPKAQTRRGKIDKLNFIKILKCCASKDTIKEVKGSLQNEKIVAKYTFDKGLVSRIYKNTYNLKGQIIQF